MRIAFSHNLRTLPTVEQAEFDSPETIDALSAALERLGHEVFRVDVTAPLPDVVARLRDIAPDLVFNTAEGTRGPHREALYPAVFEELGFAYTGSTPHVCVVTLDKALTKRVVADAGVPVPAGFVVTAHAPLPADVPLPAFAKPNFEGSSKGVTAKSLCRTRAELDARVAELLADYPDGVLVEEFVEGIDVVVPYLNGACPAFEDALSPSSYEFGTDTGGIYDYAAKNEDYDAVQVVTPAAVPVKVQHELRRLAAIAFRALQVRDLARIDFRVRPDGSAVFLEVNALPSLEPGASIYEAAAIEGMTQVEDVLARVIASASVRIPKRVPTPPRRGPVRVGLVYNLKRDATDESQAEFDSQTTIDALADAIASHGHEVVRVEAGPDLARRLESSESERAFDLAFNIAEGFRGRGRESLVPALLELHRIPYTGSDAATLAVTLDKGVAKRVVSSAGVPTAPFLVTRNGRKALAPGMDFPLMVKPVAEGSSKGIRAKSVVHNRAELIEAVRENVEMYGQPALVEAFLPGREFTIGVLGEHRLRVLPPLEVVFTSDSATPIYGYDEKKNDTGYRVECPAQVDAELAAELERVAKTCFETLGCRDVARIDVRLDAAGRVNFIECNPLPGLTPGWSDLCMIGLGAGMPYEELVGAILRPGVRRLRDARRRARQAQAIADEVGR